MTAPFAIGRVRISLIGVVKVDGVSYRFMGTEELEMNAIVPTSQQGDWTGRYTTDKPAGDWTSAGYDDSKWKSDRGAFGTKENEPTAKPSGEPAISGCAVR